MPNLDLSILQIMYGDTPVEKIMQGDTLIWPPVYDAQVEYLETDGTACINTLFRPDNNTSIEAEYSKGDTGTLIICGARTAKNSKDYTVFPNNGTSFLVRFGNRENTFNYTFVTDHVYRVTSNKRVFTVYDVTADTSVNSMTCTSSTFSCSYYMYLFALNTAGTVTVYPQKIYYFKLYDNGTLIRDYIPVRKNGVGYMYDKVTGELYGNVAGSGAFSYGSDVT